MWFILIFGFINVCPKKPQTDLNVYKKRDKHALFLIFARVSYYAINLAQFF